MSWSVQTPPASPPPPVYTAIKAAGGVWWLAHDNAGLWLCLEGNHVRTRTWEWTLSPDSTTCSAGSACPVGFARVLRSLHSLFWPSVAQSCSRPSFFFFYSHIAKHAFMCLPLAAWHCPPRQKQRSWQVYSAPPHPQPRLHVTSVEEVWAAGVFLVGWVWGITRVGVGSSAMKWFSCSVSCVNPWHLAASAMLRNHRRAERSAPVFTASFFISNCSVAAMLDNSLKLCTNKKKQHN